MKNKNRLINRMEKVSKMSVSEQYTTIMTIFQNIELWMKNLIEKKMKIEINKLEKNKSDIDQLAKMKKIMNNLEKKTMGGLLSSMKEVGIDPLLAIDLKKVVFIRNEMAHGALTNAYITKALGFSDRKAFSEISKNLVFVIGVIENIKESERKKIILFSKKNKIYTKGIIFIKNKGIYYIVNKKQFPGGFEFEVKPYKKSPKISKLSISLEEFIDNEGWGIIIKNNKKEKVWIVINE